MNIQHLYKSLGDHHILTDVCFRIQAPQVVGLLGVNGAGKSTLFKLLTGLWKPTSVGTLEIEPSVGYLPENNPLYTEMYVREYLQFIAGLYPVGTGILPVRTDSLKGCPYDMTDLLDAIGLTVYADHKIKTLSRGYKQRVGLAAALIGNPQVLLLDEPTTGLDPLQQDEIHALIRELGRTKIILFSSHVLSEVQTVCDRVMILHEGHLFPDCPCDDTLRERFYSLTQVPR